MDDRIIPVLEFIDGKSLSGAGVSLVEGTFNSEVISVVLRTGLVQKDPGDSTRYSLTVAGYRMLSESRGRIGTKHADQKALFVAIVTLIVVTVTLLVILFHL